jgi:hypothetical protein
MLHGLAPADRENILGQLDPVQRVAIEPLLEELVELGLPADTALLEELMQQPATAAPIPLKPLEVLMQADAHEVERVIAGESPVVVARLLAAADWPWQEALLARTALPRQRRTMDALAALRKSRAAQRTAATDDLLIGEMAGRVGAARRSAPARAATLRAGSWMKSLRWPAPQRRQA